MKPIFSSYVTSALKNPKRFFCSYFWKDFWVDICCFFNPRQKWLTNKISNQWMDKDQLIEVCLFETLVDYVENEEGTERPDYTEDLKQGWVTQGYVDQSLELFDTTMEVYKYIKETRPNMQKRFLEAEFPESLHVEEKMTELDTKVLTKIVELRGYLWT